MPKKIDPLNKKTYGAVTAMLTVGDIKAAVEFYRKAFGFTSRGIMNGPDGKPMHAELRLRDTTLMLGPEMPKGGARSAKTIGASPVTLYLTVEKVDQVVAKAVKLGATLKGPVGDMFWGDRHGTRTTFTPVAAGVTMRSRYRPPGPSSPSSSYSSLWR